MSWRRRPCPFHIFWFVSISPRQKPCHDITTLLTHQTSLRPRWTARDSACPRRIVRRPSALRSKHSALGTAGRRPTTEAIVSHALKLLARRSPHDRLPLRVLADE